MGEPARGYSWEPFQPGHEKSMRHGARSERRWRPLADELEAEAVQHAPWLSRPSFRAALRSWAKAEAQATLVADWLDEHGLLDVDGEPRPASTYALRLEASAQARRERLGLDPMSFAKLLATFSGTAGADDVLERLRAEGAAIMAARSMPASMPAPLPAGERPEPEPDGQTEDWS